MQKKGRTFVALVLTCCLVLGVSMAQAETLSGTAQGFGGEVKVTVTVEDGVITDCVIEGDQETAGIGSQAIEQMPEKIVAANGVDVDGVAGLLRSGVNALLFSDERLSCYLALAAEMRESARTLDPDVVL